METIELPPIAPQTRTDGTLHPQERALLSEADIIGYGGAAGSGKSWVAQYFAGRWHHVPGYGALITRRDMPELTGPGSIWEEGRRMYEAWGATCRENMHDAQWENGANVVFRHMQYEKDVEAHDGKQYGAVVIEEAQYYTEYMIWYLWGRCRTTCGIRPQMLLTHNPDPDCYLRTLFAWWIDPETGWAIPERSGVLRWALRTGDDSLRWFESEAEGVAYCDELRAQAGTPVPPELEHLAPVSITFIPGTLADNKVLLAHDPTYGARIAFQDAASRARKQGNWNARATSGSLFNRGWFKVVDAPPPDRSVQLWVRGWDKAGSAPSAEYPNPDWSASVLLAYLHNGEIVVGDVQRVRLEPGGVDAWMAGIVRTDGPKVVQAIWQDPAQAGKVDVLHTQEVMRRALPSVIVEVEVEKLEKLTYASLYSAAIDPRPRHHQLTVAIVAAPWNQPYFAELESFPPSTKSGAKKDQVDASSRAYLEIHKLREGFHGQFAAAMRRVRL